MRKTIEKRIIEEANYIIGTESTVRTIAKEFGVCKSTVHKDLTQRLIELSPQLHSSVNKIIQQNKLERSLRGGQSTRMKYKNMAVV